jgi:hypothetical protein
LTASVAVGRLNALLRSWRAGCTHGWLVGLELRA